LDDPALVKIFTELDSKGVESKEGYKGDAPLNASDWIQGPGALMVNREIDDIRERIFRYDFLPVMESIRSKVSGDGNLERFDYWMNALRFNKLVLEVTLAQVELNQIMEQIRTEPRTDIKTMMAKDEALPKRIELAHRWEAMNRILLSFVSTNGELGTIANLEMHNIRKNGNLTGHDELLKSILNEDLPGEADVPDTYSGRTRVIVTTLQSVMLQGEDFRLRIRVLDVGDRLSGKLYYRKLGGRKYSGVPMKPLSSHVFEVHIPASQLQDDFEYYIELESGREKVLFPATAGKINQTVVLL
jgi:hypothetical protein